MAMAFWSDISTVVATNTYVRTDDCNYTTWRLYFTLRCFPTAFYEQILLKSMVVIRLGPINPFTMSFNRVLLHFYIYLLIADKPT